MATATGALLQAGDRVVLALAAGGCLVRVEGAYAGLTVAFEASDGGPWAAFAVTPLGALGAGAGVTTASPPDGTTALYLAAGLPAGALLSVRCVAVGGSPGAAGGAALVRLTSSPPGVTAAPDPAGNYGSAWEAHLALMAEVRILLRVIRDEVRGCRLAAQERLNEGNAQQHDFLELAQSFRDGSDADDTQAP